MRHLIAAAASALALGGCVTAGAERIDPASARALHCLAAVELRIDRMMRDTGNVAYPSWQARDYWQRQVRQSGLERSAAVDAEMAALLRDRPQEFTAELQRCYSEAQAAQ